MSTLLHTVRQDSQHGEPLEQKRVFLADAGSNKSWVIEVDAKRTTATGDYPVLLIYRITDAGAIDTTAGSIALDLGTLGALTLTDKNAAFRVLKFKDAANGCAAMRMGILATLPEPDV